MKPARKDHNGMFICEECQRTFDSTQTLSIHISRKHHNKAYFDKWIKEPGDDICKICGNTSDIYRGFTQGYAPYCCKKCSNKLTYEKTKLGMLKKYGVDNPAKSPEVIRKTVLTNIERYGVTNIFQKPENISKCQKAVKEFYKDENKVNASIQKYEETCLKKYGVRNISQFRHINNAFKTFKFKNTGLKAQGSYELDFLEKYYDLINELIKAPKIEYFIGEKRHIYYPDFYIPSINLIIEIKSKYFAEKESELIKIKEKATIDNGFKYLMILDKNYDEFNKLMNFI